MWDVAFAFSGSACSASAPASARAWSYPRSARRRRRSGLSVRPIQWDIETPRVQVWNLNVQRELFANTAVMIGYAGSRGEHLLRSQDVNTATPVAGADGQPFFPVGVTRMNPAWTTVELKSSDGDSWYRALIVEARRRWANGLMAQSSYTWSKAEDTTQNAVFFSDSFR